MLQYYFFPSFSCHSFSEACQIRHSFSTTRGQCTVLWLRHFLPYGRHCPKQWFHLILNISSPQCTHTILQIRKLRLRANSTRIMQSSLENGAWFVWLQAYVPSNVHVASTLQMCPALKGKQECNLGIERENEAAQRMKVLAQICNFLKIYN